jgi:hypothetical protein
MSLLEQDYGDFSVLIHAKKPLARHKTRDSSLNRNAIRRMALHSDADAFFMLDSDTAIPRYALTRLASHGKDVVAGWYHLVDEPHRWAVGMFENGVCTNFTAPLPGLVKVDMVGLGCLLISRRVYETVTFDPGMSETDIVRLADGRQCNMGISAKWSLAAREAGFELHADGDVICEHLSRIEKNAPARPTRATEPGRMTVSPTAVFCTVPIASPLNVDLASLDELREILPVSKSEAKLQREREAREIEAFAVGRKAATAAKWHEVSVIEARIVALEEILRHSTRQ